ncbi:unnamed protein product, partial [marine sediment metagenome]
PDKNKELIFIPILRVEKYVVNQVKKVFITAA